MSIHLLAGKPFEDGEHILYVNGEYRGTSDIGKLMHDFSCTNANDMNFELMAQRTLFDGTLTVEKIAECVGLSLDEVKNLQTSHNA